ncbi:MAG: SGNH/GDSL hydrolase family protein [Bacteroidales bacterium]
MNWETLLCAGDSITIGARSYLSYPEYCGDFLSKETRKHWNVVNHAMPALMTIDLARSIDKNFAALKGIRPDVATILVGTNDLKSDVSPGIFKIAYSLLVLKIRLIVGNNNVILIEIPKLKNGVMLPYRIDMNQKVLEYNAIIREIAGEEGMISAPIECDDNCFFDGVHLNEQGSEVFGKQLADQILKLRTG